MARRTIADWLHRFAAVAGLSACAVLAGCADYSSNPGNNDLPQATYYTIVVRPGDTLSEIADRYDASTSAIVRLNKLSDEHHINSGQTLRIPAVGSVTREAVLSEAGNPAAPNYAPPPRPIDTTLFDFREKISVRKLPPPPESQMGPPAPDVISRTNTSGGHFVWPVSGSVISSFGAAGNGERNDGINIAATTGTPIHAAAAGTVTYAGNELKGYGNLVLIQHEDGYVTAYAHAESISVDRGAHVEKGQVIGLTGATGDVDRPQLHFEIRKGAQPINPRLLLASKG